MNMLLSRLSGGPIGLTALKLSVIDKPMILTVRIRKCHSFFNYICPSGKLYVNQHTPQIIPYHRVFSLTTENPLYYTSPPLSPLSTSRFWYQHLKHIEGIWYMIDRFLFLKKGSHNSYKTISIGCLISWFQISGFLVTYFIVILQLAPMTSSGAGLSKTCNITIE